MLKLRFHGWRDIAAAERSGDEGVVLTLKDGQRVELPTRSSERPQELLQRIDAGLAAYRGSAPDEDGSRLLRSEEKSTRVRVEMLKELGSEAQTNYREISVPRDRLWRIVEDPVHDAVTRATAAVALSGQLDDAERARLRVVAQGTASPKVRVALDAIASSADDTRVAEALAEVEAEEARQRVPTS